MNIYPDITRLVSLGEDLMKVQDALLSGDITEDQAAEQVNELATILEDIACDIKQ